MPYPLPSEYERRALFAWLKQASSLTAWRRLYSYHQVFVDAVQQGYEADQRGPRGSEELIPTGWFRDVLRDHDAFAASLERLARGDRRCFLFLGARGHFEQGLQSVRWWEDMYGGSLRGRNGFGVDESLSWPQIMKAMHDCLGALSDIGVVLQRRHTDVPTPVFRVRPPRPSKTSSLRQRWLDTPALPEVPVAEPELLVPTGATIPHFGIWEPVQVKERADMLHKLRVPKPRADDELTLDGCMNYLHADSSAPTIAFPEDGQRREGRPTTWRLVWIDDRYGNKPIPEEEKDYVFVQPVEGEVLFSY